MSLNDISKEGKGWRKMDQGVYGFQMTGDDGN